MTNSKIDLTHEPAGIFATEQSRVVSEGWGRARLDRQATGGHERPRDEGWIATTDALVLLREMGLDPSGAGATRAIGRRSSARESQLRLNAVLDVLQRPLRLGGRIITPVEKRLERFDDDSFVFRFFGIQHRARLYGFEYVKAARFTSPLLRAHN